MSVSPSPSLEQVTTTTSPGLTTELGRIPNTTGRDRDWVVVDSGMGVVVVVVVVVVVGAVVVVVVVGVVVVGTTVISSMLDSTSPRPSIEATHSALKVPGDTSRLSVFSACTAPLSRVV